MKGEVTEADDGVNKIGNRERKVIIGKQWKRNGRK